MKECVSRDINVESEYPSVTYLFRCLGSPLGDPIARIVATANFIVSSSKLEDICRFFLNMSAALQNVNASNVAQLLKPLQSRSIFPITNDRRKGNFDNLTDVHSTSWFIADLPQIQQSFYGKIPLLALPIEDLSAMKDLIRALRLDGRMLSKRATSRTYSKGQITTHYDYTDSLRTKSPFIKA